MKHARFGFLYEPGSEGEVYLLFGCLMPYIGEELERLGIPASEYYVEEWIENPTDIVLQADGKRLRVEFELYSSNFQGRHDPEKCDLIICWKNDWLNAPIKILELSKIVAEKVPEIIIRKEPKYPQRRVSWSLEDFMKIARNNLQNNDFEGLKLLIEELRSSKDVELQLGKGDKIPTIGIYFRKLNTAPVTIEATGKAYIAYFNVNVKPPKPLMPEDKISEIRKFLNEPEKQWHYISAANMSDLIGKIREIIKIILQA